MRVHLWQVLLGAFIFAKLLSYLDMSAHADRRDDVLAFDAYIQVLIASRACGIENDARVAEVANWIAVAFDDRKAAVLTDNLDNFAATFKASLSDHDIGLDCEDIMGNYLNTTWPSELP